MHTLLISNKQKREMGNHSATALSLSLLFLSVVCSAGCGAKPCIGQKIPPKEPPVNPFCPVDTLKLGACASALGVAGLVVGEPLGSKCCDLLGGLADGEAAACLCTFVKERVLGISTEWRVAVSLLVSSCKEEVPDGFKCF